VSIGGSAAGVSNAAAYGSLALSDTTLAITLQAQWVQIDYTVRYLPGAHGTFGTTAIGGLHYGDATPAAPAATGEAGWRFTGWTPVRGLVVTGDADYTAGWVLNTYTISYHGNGHTSGSEPAVVTLNHGDTWTVSAAGSLARTGYTFAGWAPSAAATAATYSPGAANTLTGDVNLYAVWTPAVTPPTPTDERTTDTDTNLESEPEPQAADIAAALIADGFTQQDVERFEAQTGNPLADLFNGNVPLGSGKSSAVWSLLSLIFAVIAVIITVLLAIGSLARRRNGGSEIEYSVYGRDEAEKRRRRGRLLKLLACIVGILTLIIWLVLDDTSLPMAWINRYTPIVTVFFVIQIALFAVYRVRRGRQDDDTESEAGSAAS
jgi:uncharacterized repeat protein (TIGR02543 family)